MSVRPLVWLCGLIIVGCYESHGLPLDGGVVFDSALVDMAAFDASDGVSADAPDSATGMCATCAPSDLIGLATIPSTRPGDPSALLDMVRVEDALWIFALREAPPGTLGYVYSMLRLDLRSGLSQWIPGGSGAPRTEESLVAGAVVHVEGQSVVTVALRVDGFPVGAPDIVRSTWTAGEATEHQVLQAMPERFEDCSCTRSAVVGGSGDNAVVVWRSPEGLRRWSAADPAGSDPFDGFSPPQSTAGDAVFLESGTAVYVAGGDAQSSNVATRPFVAWSDPGGGIAEALDTTTNEVSPAVALDVRNQRALIAWVAESATTFGEWDIVLASTREASVLENVERVSVPGLASPDSVVVASQAWGDATVVLDQAPERSALFWRVVPDECPIEAVQSIVLPGAVTSSVLGFQGLVSSADEAGVFLAGRDYDQNIIVLQLEPCSP